MGGLLLLPVLHNSAVYLLRMAIPKYDYHMYIRIFPCMQWTTPWRVEATTALLSGPRLPTGIG